MKLKFLLLSIIFFANTLFSNTEIKIWAHGDIIDPIALSSLLDKPGITIPAPDFLASNWTEGDFGSGDTTATFEVSHAKIVYFVYGDSSMSGVDTVWFGITNTLSNGLVIDCAVKLQAMNQTTSTTFLSGAVLIPGDNTKTIYTFIPTTGSQETFTGTIKIARLNVNDNVTPYLPKGRFIFAFE